MSRMPARRLLEPCLRIDRMAQTLYARLADATAQPELRELWEEMGREEAGHVEIWARALEAWGNEPVPRVFDLPEALRGDLEALERQVAALLDGAAPADAGEAFLTAFRLEFYLLDPAMDVLLLHAAEVSARPADAEYASHIERFVEAFERHRGRDPMAQLSGEMITRLWTQNRVIARHIKALHELKTLLPICAGCKKIRDDAGYWQHLETYLKTHAGLEFTHGLCPDCVKTLYPELGPGSSDNGKTS
ncbi:hypothetical protein [Deferrisoma sp.]